MISEKTITDKCNQYLRQHNSPLYVIYDLENAVIAGGEDVSAKYHELAKAAAKEYIKNKDVQLVYTETNVEAAYRHGANVVLKEVVKEQGQVRLSNFVKRQDMQKAMKLICAGQQMMTIANEFNKEAEKLLSKRGVFRTQIKCEWGKLAKIFDNINSLLSKTFCSFSIDEVDEWGNEAEELEIAIRKIMKIDMFEEPKKLN